MIRYLNQVVLLIFLSIIISQETVARSFDSAPKNVQISDTIKIYKNIFVISREVFNRLNQSDIKYLIKTVKKDEKFYRKEYYIKGLLLTIDTMNSINGLFIVESVYKEYYRFEFPVVKIENSFYINTKDYYYADELINNEIYQNGLKFFSIEDLNRIIKRFNVGLVLKMHFDPILK